METIDGTAEAVKDYIPVRQTVAFAPDEVLQHVEIALVDGNVWRPDDFFFVKLSLEVDDGTPTSFMEVEDESQHTTVLGKTTIQEIAILNEESPGMSV